MRNQTQQFFDALFATKPEEAFILIWRLAGKLSNWFKTPDEAAEYAAANADEDLYVEVGLSPSDFGPHQRCAAKDVIGIPALWIDFDVLGPAHQKTNLPSNITEALSILPPEFPPSMVVHSGHGVHAYWLFKEVELFEDADDRSRAAEVIQKWERFIRLRAQVKGWTIDATHDLSRILRIPGTSNNKLPDNRAKAQIFALDERRYNLTDFEDFLEGVTALAEAPSVAARHVAAPSVNVAGLRIDASRSLHPEKLALLLDDQRFAETWNHKRRDMTGDGSQSAYDLALGNMLFEAGCSDQEIVDAMIENRRLRGVKSKLRLDYYQRTLSAVHRKRRGALTIADVDRAALPQAKEGPDRGSGIEAAPPAQPVAAVAEPEEPKPLRDEDKGPLFEKLSVLLGLIDKKEKPIIVRIVKVKGSKPIWRIELKSSAVITLTSANAIFEQGRLRSAIYSATNNIMPKYKPDAWEAVIKEFTASIIEVDAGAENTESGTANWLTEQYLMACGVKESQAVAFADVKNNYGPFEVEGRIAVSALDWMDWAARTRNIKKEINEVAHFLSMLGATPRDFHVGDGRVPQNRWILPASFSPDQWRKHERAARLGVQEEAE